MRITAQIPLLKGYTDEGQRLFMKKSGNIVHALNARMRKAKVEGRLSLEEGRKALAECLDKPCKYCLLIVRIKTMSLDHPMPVDRGGDWTIVEGCCEMCNKKKGGLTSDEYLSLCAHVRTFAPEAQLTFQRMLGFAAAHMECLKRNRREFMIRKNGQGRTGVGSAQEVDDIHLIYQKDGI